MCTKCKQAFDLGNDTWGKIENNVLTLSYNACSIVFLSDDTLLVKVWLSRLNMRECIPHDDFSDWTGSDVVGPVSRVFNDADVVTEYLRICEQLCGSFSHLIA